MENKFNFAEVKAVLDTMSIDELEHLKSVLEKLQADQKSAAST